jgi:hypothetical protein
MLGWLFVAWATPEGVPSDRKERVAGRRGGPRRSLMQENR